MDGCFGPRDLEALQNLICPPKEDDDSDAEDDLPQAGARKLGELRATEKTAISIGANFVKTARARESISATAISQNRGVRGEGSESEEPSRNLRIHI